MDKRRNFTATQVAELAGCTRQAIHKARRKGRFPHVSRDRFSNIYKFTRADVKEFLLRRGICLSEVEEGDK